jgi:hypothetical protein
LVPPAFGGCVRIVAFLRKSYRCIAIVIPIRMIVSRHAPWRHANNQTHSDTGGYDF